MCSTSIDSTLVFARLNGMTKVVKIERHDALETLLIKAGIVDMKQHYAICHGKLLQGKLSKYNIPAQSTIFIMQMIAGGSGNPHSRALLRLRHIFFSVTLNGMEWSGME